MEIGIFIGIYKLDVLFVCVHLVCYLFVACLLFVLACLLFVYCRYFIVGARCTQPGLYLTWSQVIDSMMTSNRSFSVNSSHVTTFSFSQDHLPLPQSLRVDEKGLHGKEHQTVPQRPGKRWQPSGRERRTREIYSLRYEL